MKHIVSFSGGKDSTAMLIRMLELGMQVDRIIFADTMFEFPEMYEYISKIDKYIKKFGDYNIEILRTNESIDKWIFGSISRGKRKGEIRGWPLVAYPCAWSRESKFKVLERECTGNIRYIGIALDEKNRMVKNYYERGYRYPLIEWGWTEEDALNYLKDKNLHNPLYDRFDRLGCWWCPKQSLNSVKSLIQHYPQHWDKLKEMDKKIKEADPSREWKPGYSLKELEDRFK